MYICTYINNTHIYSHQKNTDSFYAPAKYRAMLIHVHIYIHTDLYAQMYTYVWINTHISVYKIEAL
jgi:hypothetical protein